MLAVKILLAEDVHMIRGALIALLELEPDLRVIASVDRGDKIVEAALASRPDVAVVDIDLPGIDGLTAAAELHQRLPDCRTLILTSLGRPGTLRRALASQVTGFLLKDAPPDQLAQAVRSVAAGRRVIDPQLALAAWDSPENPLSPRELEVLRLAARGADAAEIAGCLFLSQGTVRNYLTAIVTKLNARNRIDAVRIAEEAGWIP
ncbi:MULTISPECIES: DNA-binding response regulator [Streptomyces]|uniref:Response regulator transcription factor n=1 Tax=Streptomyces decoyicus TaxID=249567 RepID=A0ABZ1FBB4_9ACTN|nr:MULTISPECIES: response regulator transcription factor [Streptomyces]KOG47598.1 MerR family transcriptional regulator [Streptomyces decoyicus]MCL7495518.1 response regulator transcription factor [Streptomyces sp. MCA2]QZY19403.1 response regulator transcription factor [Streptomyces decoyicus]WSB67451.1 response regulator transcription factor [Streptomyces decoyicus]WSV45238.1 response regulator transcription factor [Streptomyces decoyicus]